MVNFHLDWFLKKSGNTFNMQEDNFNVVIWGKDGNNEELFPLYSVNKLMYERSRWKRFLNC